MKERELQVTTILASSRAAVNNKGKTDDMLQKKISWEKLNPHRVLVVCFLSGIYKGGMFSIVLGF